MTPDVREVAFDAVCLGFSVVPPREDGTKAPMGCWKTFMSRLPDLEELESWYGVEGPPLLSGIGLVCGAVSGNLECLEFDACGRCYEPFKERARALGLGPLIDRLDAGYRERSPSGGPHWPYRVKGRVAGNTVLAAYESDEVNPKTGKPIIRPLIETRGEGGFIIVAPTNGHVHPTGRPYVLESGSLATVQVIAAEERDSLHELARTFDELPETEPKFRPGGKAAGSVIDEFNARTSWEELLAGWVVAYESAGVRYWRRPGKAVGVSATTGRNDHDRIWNFSSSADLPVSPPALDKLDVYAIRKFNGDLKAAIDSLRPPAAKSSPALDAKLAWYPRTEYGNAERLVARFGRNLRHIGLWSKYLAWYGTRWQIDHLGHSSRFAKKTARLILAEAATIQNEDKKKEAELIETMKSWARASESNGAIRAMLALAATEKEISVEHTEFDTNPWLITLLNGTIDLRTGTLREHRREDLITHLAPVRYDPDAKCPLWEETLKLVFGGDQTLIDYFQRLCGVFLTATTTEQILPIMWGEGQNGKSTIIGALLEIMGEDLALQAPRGLLMAKRNEQHPTELAKLHKKRLVAVVETGEGEKMDEVLVKHLTGGDSITARRMREDFWQFKPTHTPVLSTNHKPVIIGMDFAIWRRIHLIPFTVQIPTDKVILDMPNRLRAEYAGIFTWMVRGCLAWQRDGLKPPKTVLDATKAYKTESDVVGRFLADECNVSESLTVEQRANAVYERYKAWATRTGEEILRARDFSPRLKKVPGIKHHEGRNYNFYTGLLLKPKDEPELIF